MSRAERQAKAINWIAAASAVLAAVTVLAAAISLPILIDASGGIKAQRRSDEIAACLSALNAQAVVAKSNLDVIYSEGLEAVAIGDNARLHELAPISAERRLVLVDAAEAYGEGSALAESDPEAFLEACRKRTG